jgi:hypothetical protein
MLYFFPVKVSDCLETRQVSNGARQRKWIDLHMCMYVDIFYFSDSISDVFCVITLDCTMKLLKNLLCPLQHFL